MTDLRQDLKRFTAESNRIEGITRPPTGTEVDALETFIALPCVTVGDLTGLVVACQPDAQLRDQHGLDVYVGNHRPPPGGPIIRGMLTGVLTAANDGAHPHGVHHEYEALHPYTDGNGRSGRALWLWGMRRYSENGFNRALEIGFLHSYYYQSLEFSRLRST